MQTFFFFCIFAFFDYDKFCGFFGSLFFHFLHFFPVVFGFLLEKLLTVKISSFGPAFPPTQKILAIFVNCFEPQVQFQPGDPPSAVPWPSPTASSSCHRYPTPEVDAGRGKWMAGGWATHCTVPKPQTQTEFLEAHCDPKPVPAIEIGGHRGDFPPRNPNTGPFP